MLPTRLLAGISAEQIGACTSGPQCHALLQSLPTLRKGLFLWLLEMMADVAERAECNRMNERAIAVVIAPNLYDQPTDAEIADPMAALNYTQGARAVFSPRNLRDGPCRQAGCRVARGGASEAVRWWLRGRVRVTRTRTRAAAGSVRCAGMARFVTELLMHYMVVRRRVRTESSSRDSRAALLQSGSGGAPVPPAESASE